MKSIYTVTQEAIFRVPFTCTTCGHQAVAIAKCRGTGQAANYGRQVDQSTREVAARLAWFKASTAAHELITIASCPACRRRPNAAKYIGRRLVETIFGIGGPVVGFLLPGSTLPIYAVFLAPFSFAICIMRWWPMLRSNSRVAFTTSEPAPKCPLCARSKPTINSVCAGCGFNFDYNHQLPYLPQVQHRPYQQAYQTPPPRKRDNWWVTPVATLVGLFVFLGVLGRLLRPFNPSAPAQNASPVERTPERQLHFAAPKVGLSGSPEEITFAGALDYAKLPVKDLFVPVTLQGEPGAQLEFGSQKFVVGDAGTVDVKLDLLPLIDKMDRARIAHFSYEEDKIPVQRRWPDGHSSNDTIETRDLVSLAKKWLQSTESARFLTPPPSGKPRGIYVDGIWLVGPFLPETGPLGEVDLIATTKTKERSGGACGPYGYNEVAPITKLDKTITVRDRRTGKQVAERTFPAKSEPCPSSVMSRGGVVSSITHQPDPKAIEAFLRSLLR
ncbi:MAG: hypothetical protein U0271_03205 [Polyangiaceae bacterium]